MKCQNSLISTKNHHKPLSLWNTIDDEQVRQIVKTYDTPTFIFDPSVLESALLNFSATWENYFPTGKIYYSYKTNYIPEVCNIAHKHGLGADVVSGYELEHALRLCDNNKIVFNGPMKTELELSLACKHGVLRLPT